MKLRTCVLLLLLPALTVGAEHVRGSVGGTVLLPCTYPVTGGTTSMCWGRGHCPTSKCLDPILRTDRDGKEVIWHQSERYRLLGNIEQRDVSLTISQLTFSDSGTYCCRVEIPGWFNDQKGEIQVSVDEAPMEEEYAEDIVILPKILPVFAPDRAALQIHPTTVTQENQETKETDPLDPVRENKEISVINIIRIVLIFSLLPLALIIFLCTYSVSMGNKQ
ncbi:hepatitis A virus cellular receptor 1 homolog [Xenopus tropicalis]|uniref:Hepatitis A virus cellular receptor 1 homolog n=1 Tax=Xenopus tropicalis TaxID=8364 RepID=A0A6I8PWM6_XENTR|nr:hepatitis A virus cellular receptor 1 homolog [Xenopus tropicalis]|eukprot:XP_004919988.1 PREDICTED: hepatitis A virus cellular receptor 1 homolog [Xenopus tropicalis]